MKSGVAAHEKFSFQDRRKFLRKFRKEVGLTQTELAKMCELSTPMISAFELGHRDLSPDAFQRVQDVVIKVLGEKRSEIIEGESARMFTRPAVMKLSDLAYLGEHPRRAKGKAPMRSAAQWEKLEGLDKDVRNVLLEFSTALGEKEKELVAMRGKFESLVQVVSEWMNVQTDMALGHEKAEVLEERARQLVAKREEKE